MHPTLCSNCGKSLTPKKEFKNQIDETVCFQCLEIEYAERDKADSDHSGRLK